MGSIVAILVAWLNDVKVRSRNLRRAARLGRIDLCRRRAFDLRLMFAETACIDPLFGTSVPVGLIVDERAFGFVNRRSGVQSSQPAPAKSSS
jgi:hypothetical protein